MKVLISGMASWHMDKTAASFEKLGILSGMWVSNKTGGFLLGNISAFGPTIWA